MEKLSDELLLLTFEQLSGQGRLSLPLKTLRLVCRRLCSIASTVLFQRVVVQYPTFKDRTSAASPHLLRSLGLVRFLTDHEHIRAQVKIVSIHGQFLGREVPDALDLEGALMVLLPLLPRLKRVWYVKLSLLLLILLCADAAQRDPDWCV
jgi:hypothetical protein